MTWRDSSGSPTVFIRRTLTPPRIENVADLGQPALGVEVEDHLVDALSQRPQDPTATNSVVVG